MDTCVKDMQLNRIPTNITCITVFRAAQEKSVAKGAVELIAAVGSRRSVRRFIPVRKIRFQAKTAIQYQRENGWNLNQVHRVDEVQRELDTVVFQEYGT